MSADEASFFPLFDRFVYRLVDSIASITYTTRAVLHDFSRDGVRYLELRTTPRTIKQASISEDVYIATVLNAIDDFESETNSLMPTYLILSIDRRQELKQAMSTVEMAIRLRDEGHKIIGIDLCGNPAHPMIDLEPAFNRAKAGGLKIALHYAEIPASSSRRELETLLSYEPDRLGHVIHVPEDLRAEIARRRIGVELCLSCNVLAQMTQGGFEGHHLKEWRHTGSPVALSVNPVIRLALSPVFHRVLTVFTD